jgi:hypothetical protein
VRSSWKAIVALATVLGLVTSLMVLWPIIFPTSPTTVPNVVSDHVDQATLKIKEAYLIPRATYEPSKTVQKYVVFDQDPPAGIRVERGTVVIMSVSAGWLPSLVTTSVLTGDKISWGSSGFSLSGLSFGLENATGANMYVLVHSITLNKYWVQEPPVMKAGTWEVRVRFGLQNIAIGEPFEVVTIMTYERLTPGDVLSSPPGYVAIDVVELQRAE